ncbi:MAG: tetratricopeptide repeat protein [Candidatus Thorarchaeota archaeon]
MTSDDADYPIELLYEFKRMFEKGQDFIAEGKYRKAIEIFRKAMEMTEPDEVVMNYIAECHLFLNQRDKGIAVLRKAIEINPYYDEGLNNISLLLTEKGNLKEAESYIRRAIEVSPTRSNSWWSLGRILYQQGEFEEAMRVLATSVGLAPDNADAYHYLGLTLEHLGQIEKAERALHKAAELGHDVAEIISDYGRFLMRHDRPRDAIEVLQQASEVDSYDYTILTSQAEAIIAVMREQDIPDREDLADRAMKALNQSLDLNPVYGKTWFHWGEITLFHRAWEKGERLFRHCIECGYEGPMAWAWLSLMVDKQGRKAEAEEIFEEFKRRRDALEESGGTLDGR